TLTGGKDSKLKSVFPQKLDIGGFYKITERDTIFGEYSWTDYSRNSEIKIEGELFYAGALNVLEDGAVKQNWHDAHAAKIGYEHQFESWAIRGGYAYTSQVTDDNAASLTFFAPSHGQTVTIGAGTAFLENSLHVDVAGEWSQSEGPGSREGLTTPVSGKYTGNAYGLHSSVRYTF
ncbi:MAG: outer membrane protein transport protein, partial [Bacteriovoracaceae bacterium]|nr:outer membrane protein transport protein [Bacteriovoracaceae bacterium]